MKSEIIIHPHVFIRKSIKLIINGVIITVLLSLMNRVGILSTATELHCITKPTNQQLTNAGYLMWLIRLT